MTDSYTYFADLAAELPEIPPDSILSRTLLAEGGTKVIVFGFAPGQELSEHTSAYPAVLQLLAGRATLTLGGESIEAEAGAWAHMPARLPHSVLAHTPVSLLLILLPGDNRSQDTQAGA